MNGKYDSFRIRTFSSYHHFTFSSVVAHETHLSRNQLALPASFLSPPFLNRPFPRVGLQIHMLYYKFLKDKKGALTQVCLAAQSPNKVSKRVILDVSIPVGQHMI